MEAIIPLCPRGELLISNDEGLAFALRGVAGHWEVPSKAWDCAVVLRGIGGVERVDVAPGWTFTRRGREIQVTKCGYNVGSCSARSLALAVALITGRDYTKPGQRPSLLDLPRSARIQHPLRA